MHDQDLRAFGNGSNGLKASGAAATDEADRKNNRTAFFLVQCSTFHGNETPSRVRGCGPGQRQKRSALRVCCVKRSLWRQTVAQDCLKPDDVEAAKGTWNPISAFQPLMTHPIAEDVWCCCA